MAVTQTLRALGSWDLSLREDTPAEVWDNLDYFGHLAIHMGRQNPQIAADSLLKSARYVGVLRKKSESGMPKKIGGLDVAMWLGDPDNKSDVVETELTVNGTFQDVIADVLAGFDAVQPGTIYSVAETFSGIFQFQSRRQIIDYICQTIGEMAWRVNGDATLDAGRETDLFVTNPEVAVIRKQKNLPSLAGSEVDMFMRSFDGLLETDQDVEDLTTRVLLMAQGMNGQFVAAAKDAPPGTHPFLDMHGNPIKFTRIVQESETSEGNAEARAQLALNRFLGTRDALNLSTDFYDVTGVARVGDYLWVHDPIMNLVDNANEVIFRGQRLNPLKLQMTETTWPVVRGMSVFYRHYMGDWVDLTDYIVWESGSTNIVVGGYNRSLNDSGIGQFPITQPETNTTIPGQVEWDLPWTQSMYQSPITGESKSEVELKWLRPDNTDLSSISDGDYFEFRFRQSNVPLGEYTVDETTGFEIDELNTVNNPLTLGIEQEWQYGRAPWDTLKFRLQELTPAMPYEVQIRAFDTGRPPNIGEWSEIVAFQASRDIFPPATPAAPFIAANPMAVLVEHHLGRADGGEYNLDRDLGHLEVHGAEDPLFAPVAETLIGKIPATWGMISGEVPVVASFQITSLIPMYYKVVAVDLSGNKSLPSAGVVATAELIDNQFVRSLTVDKITAGTISADFVLGARITTGKTGARVELSQEGIHGYNPTNQRLLDWESDTGTLNVIGTGGMKVRGGGNVQITDGRLEILNSAGQVILEVGECSDGRHGVQVYTDAGIRVARMGELQTGAEGIELINDLGTLVRVDTLAFGMKSANVSGNLAVSHGAAFNAAAPSVSGVVIGNTGRALVHIGSWITTGATNNGAMSFYGTGPGGASFASNILQSINASSGLNLGLGRSFEVTGLAPGSWLFGCSYSSQFAGQNANFTNRSIAVQPF